MFGPENKTCLSCGETFYRKKVNTWAYWSKAKYCSSKCYGTAHKAASAASRPSREAKFSEWFTRSDGCWEWHGAKDKDGYGIFNYGRKNSRAPKIALELAGRPVPRGMMACHTCDNPGCVRPDHLYPGTPKQNVADMIQRGRANYAKKLTSEQASQIRHMPGDHGEIAAAFGVSRSNVSMIKHGKIWRNAQ